MNLGKFQPWTAGIVVSFNLMKIIHCIFSIYLIVISCLPCADLEVNKLSNSSQEIASNDDRHSHDSNDVCPPFCVCGCCGSQVFVNYAHYNFSNLKIIITKKTPEYQSLLTSTYFGSIWQPPQINGYI
jgi:hypothetical protein